MSTSAAGCRVLCSLQFVWKRGCLRWKHVIFSCISTEHLRHQLNHYLIIFLKVISKVLFSNSLVQLSIFLIDFVGTYRLSSHARLEALVIQTELIAMIGACWLWVWSKECVITGIEGLMSSGSGTNVTGTLFRMKNTFCWTVRMNILSAFAHSTASWSSHLSMRIAQVVWGSFWTSQICTVWPPRERVFWLSA